MSKRELINDFNDGIIDLAKDMAEISPDSIIGQNIKEIERIVKKPKHFDKFIDLFVEHVLKFEKEIMVGNDEFFLNKHYNEVDNSDYLNKIFEFKNVWKRIDNENKEVIKERMQILCMLAREYFNIVNEETK